MVENITQSNVSISEGVRGSSSPAVLNVKMLMVQVLVGAFFYLNCLMLFTFFKREAFWTNTRYILFAQTLLSYSVFLVLTDLVILLNCFYIMMPVGLCLLLCMIMDTLSCTTPLTITAMCLERYMAVCLPLRHADISTTKRRLHGILLIWWLSLIPPSLSLFIIFETEQVHLYEITGTCTYQIMFPKQWLAYMRSTVAQLYFSVLIVIIIFTYIKIFFAARAASAETRKPMSKGHRTVMLHALQLLLCVVEMLCPLIETAVMEINFNAFINLRYFDFLAFSLASRCLSPLIYGLRDEQYFKVLKCYAVFGYSKKISPVLVQA